MKILNFICDKIAAVSKWALNIWWQILVTIVFIIGVYSYLQDSSIKYYYLDSSGPNKLTICTEVDYFPNSSIILQEGTTIEEALEIVNKLNESLKKAKND